MTNQEYMLTLRPSDCYSVMAWLFFIFSPRHVSSTHAIISWLKAEAVVGQWEKVSGCVTAGGDPVYRCAKCGGSEHVYGIEHRYNHNVICGNCGIFNIYGFEDVGNGSENAGSDA